MESDIDSREVINQLIEMKKNVESVRMRSLKQSTLDSYFSVNN